ncbi:MAG: translation initiation factor eIF-2B [Promethearchaeota archaeon]
MINEKIKKMLNNLRKNNRSGASEFIDKALNIVKSQLEVIPNQTKDIKDIIIELSKEIINSQPSMAPLINTIGYLISDLDFITKKSILYRIEQFNIKKIESEKALEKIFCEFINNNYKQKLKIMLISYSSTILNLLLKFKEYEIEFYVLESRPLLEGQRTAESLSPYFKTYLIIDAALGKYIDNIDLVLIGIDSILKDGSIINKIGTYPLAVLANENNIDVYAVGNSLKYNLKNHFGQNIIIEKKPITEVYNDQISNKNLEVFNYYFDITPSKYITGIISELGILTIKEFLTKIKKNLPINWFQSFLENNS